MGKQNLAFGCGVLAIFGAAFVLAQDAPKPGPQHKAMGYFTGKWLTEGEMQPGPYGPGGKMTSTDTCEWFDGGFQVVCKGNGKSAMGSMSSLGVLAYSDADKAYTYYGIDNSGMSELSKGTYTGKKWTFNSTSNMGGQTFKSRYTMTELSPTSYTFLWETSSDGTKWTKMMEGKSTKAGS